MKGEKSPRLSKWADLVWAVVVAYTRIKQAPAISAFQIDPLITQSTRLSPNGIHYIADTERIVNDLLRLHPEQRDSILAGWSSLLRSAVRSEKLTTITANDVVFIQMAGPIFKARGLWPKAYFKPNKHPKPKTTLTGRARLSMPVMRRAA